MATASWWLIQRINKSKQEDVRVHTKDANIRCDECIEKIITNWLKEAKLEADAFSKFLKIIGFEMPINLTNLNLWKNMSVLCTDARGKKVEIIIENRSNHKGKHEIIIKTHDSHMCYTADEIAQALEKIRI